ncbi:MAG: tRNA pseudouridine(55) synthase TruB [Desulfuromonadaceae bacterium]|nr:tRNA pseudouridine(55) synthase TruB [Desulfuromonadaceae bacterium]MDD5105834.1 tRNA pseudouridine(55) synthase TruB [Desulfuromonadaceae bacterium]
MNGFIIIDKPAGITSHDVVSRVRRILGTKKVGHTGTLDPFATGVLPVAVNDGTKVIPFLDEGTKVYEAEMRLGVTTDTLDMTGTVLSESDPSLLTRDQLNAVLAGFTGTIQQTPPMYSAIKQDGQPLYKLARQGVEVERKAREVTIHSLELLSFNLPYASIRVHCSRGTYIRSLADDIGRTCGLGAALRNLRRTASGPFHIEQAITLDELATAAGEECVASLCLSPLSALDHLSEIELTAEGMAGLAFGKPPSWQATVKKIPLNVPMGTVVRLTYGGTLTAVATLVASSGGDSAIALKRVFVK